MRARLILLCLSLLAFLSPAAKADENAVRASLLSTQMSVAPGEDVTLALRLDHADGWHTYWRNPGIGEATELDWSLPEGWSASGIDWPTPVKIIGLGDALTGHGYDGVIHLPVTVSVPEDAPVGETVALSARADWLMCTKEICIPGGADLDIELPIDADGGQGDDAVRALLDAQSMPTTREDWTLTAARDGETLTLSIGADADLAGAHFFPGSELVLFSADQGWAGGGAQSIALEIDDWFEGPTDRLDGVIAYSDAAGRYQGVTVDVPVSEASSGGLFAAPGAQGGGLGAGVAGFLAAAVFAFLGGIILNLMPCVLPVLSLKAISLIKSADKDPGHVRRDGWIYTAGVLAAFVVVAGALVLARGLIEGAGWGFHLQNPFVVLSLAMVMAVVGYNLLGVFEIGGAFTGAGSNLTEGNTTSASFFTGALAVVVATPCTAPFMAAALGYAMVQPPLVAIAVFLALGLGLAFPYLVLTHWPAARNHLPKPGAWMVTLRQVLAFPMFGAVIWLIWVAGAQRGIDAMALGLIAVLALGLAAWALGKLQQRGARASWSATALVSTLLAFVSIGAVSATAGLGGGAAASGLHAREAPYDPQVLETLLADDASVFVYFTAAWCISCKVNERVAINIDSTADLFADRGVTVMVGDWTNQDIAITEKLAQYDRVGVPLYLYYPSGERSGDARVLPQLLTPDIVRDAILAG